jgi:hypothetical protein
VIIRSEKDEFRNSASPLAFHMRESHCSVEGKRHQIQSRRTYKHWRGIDKFVSAMRRDCASADDSLIDSVRVW